MAECKVVETVHEPFDLLDSLQYLRECLESAESDVLEAHARIDDAFRELRVIEESLQAQRETSGN